MSVLLLVLTSCGDTTSTQTGIATPRSQPTQSATPTASTVPGQQPPPLQHIFLIMMENEAASSIFGNTSEAPYLNQLANSYGVAPHYFGVTHPSLPNYLSTISGDFQGIWDDCAAGSASVCAPSAFGSSLTSREITTASQRPHMFNGPTLVDQLEAKHMTWKAYMQSMPAVGFTGYATDVYAQKHNPFMYFSRIRNNPARMQRIVPFSQFSSDIQSPTTPNFVWITPDLCHDMHGATPCSINILGLGQSSIARGDSFIHSVVPQIMNAPAWKASSAIIIVWDESESSNAGCCKGPTGVQGTALGGGNVPIIVITSSGPRHISLGRASYNHYSLLATIESLWNLGCLANTCGISGANLLTPLFRPGT